MKKPESLEIGSECSKCNIFWKPPRAYHCRICKKCVYKVIFFNSDGPPLHLDKQLHRSKKPEIFHTFPGLHRLLHNSLHDYNLLPFYFLFPNQQGITIRKYYLS